MLYTFIALIILVTAFTITKRANPSRPSDAISRLAGQVLFFGLLVGILTYALPELWVRLPGMAQAGWGGAVAQTSSDVRVVRDSVSMILNRSDNVAVGSGSGIVVTAPPPPAQTAPGIEFEVIQPTQPADSQQTPGQAEVYVVRRGDTLTEIAQQHGMNVTDLLSLNAGINPDLLHEGDELVIGMAAPQPTATPAPTAAPTAAPQPTAVAEQPIDFGPLATAKGTADRVTGKALLAAILSTHPDNPTALAEQQAISDAETKIGQWQAISEQDEAGNFVMAEADHSQVTDLLRGLSYRVQSIESVFLTKDKWQETATIVVTSQGWLYGETITLAAGHLARWGVNEAGVDFSLSY